MRRIIISNQWSWPGAANEEVQAIINGLPTYSPNQAREDIVKWSLSADGKFTVKSTWEHIRGIAPKISWHSVVWFGQDIPMMAFIMWLAIKLKLSTKDRL